jgi:hypothetical protein
MKPKICFDYLINRTFQLFPSPPAQPWISKFYVIPPKLFLRLQKLNILKIGVNIRSLDVLRGVGHFIRMHLLKPGDYPLENDINSSKPIR